MEVIVYDAVCMAVCHCTVIKLIKNQIEKLNTGEKMLVPQTRKWKNSRRKKNVCVRKKKWQSMNAVKIIAHNIIVIRDECVFSRQTVTVDR